MMTDPDPGYFPAVNFCQGAIVIAHPYRPDFALQVLKSQRGMTLIFEPQLVIFPRQFLNLRGQGVEKMPEASRAR